MVSFVMKLAYKKKHKSTEAYLVKFKENLSSGFKIIDIFCNDYILEHFTSIKKK